MNVTLEQQAIADDLYRLAEQFSNTVDRALDLDLEVKASYDYFGTDFSNTDRHRLMVDVMTPEKEQPDRKIYPSWRRS